MKSFKEFLSLLSEGGNFVYQGIPAQEINLTEINRTEFVKKLKSFLTELNKEYRKEYKEDLWNKELLETEKFLSGSSYYLFQLADKPKGISDKKFIESKPTVGDIDLQVNKNDKDNIRKFLSNIIDKKINCATLYGFKDSKFSESKGGQIITLWKIDINDDKFLNIQFDFELVEYENNQPSEWANFSHSSHWNDISNKIKGAFHKLLLRAITHKNEFPFILKMKTKEKLMPNNNLYAFSVDRGTRLKYAPVINSETGKQETNDNGLLKFTELETKDSTYFTKLIEIFEVLFNKKPNTSDIENFKSFIGLIKLIKKYVTDQKETETIFNTFFNLIFGKSASGMYINDPEKDYSTKIIAL